MGRKAARILAGEFVLEVPGAGFAKLIDAHLLIPQAHREGGAGKRDLGHGHGIGTVDGGDRAGRLARNGDDLGTGPGTTISTMQKHLVARGSGEPIAGHGHAIRPVRSPLCWVNARRLPGINTR